MIFENLKKVTTVLILALAAILVQGTILRTFFPTAYLPNFLVTILVFIAFREISVAGVTMAFFLGLLLDLFSGQLLGPWAGSYVAVFALFSLFAQRVYVGSFLVVMVAASFASVLSSIVFVFITAPFVQDAGWSVSMIVFEALLSGIFSPLIFGILSKVYPAEQMTTVRHGRVF